ncbi:hypothetical protein PAMP_005959 [Pampus punctatissimus]
MPMGRLQLLDIAGQEQFKKMSRVYFKWMMVAVVVFDITNSSTLEAASQWKQDLDSKVLTADIQSLLSYWPTNVT